MIPNKKIKILHTIRQGKVGGGETHILNLIKNTDTERFEPLVLSFTDGQMITKLKDIGIENYVINSEKAFDFFKWGRIKNLVKEKQIDLVHIHGTRATSNIYWAAKKLHLPTVYTIHGWSFHDDQSALIKKSRIFFERWITQQTNYNISVSASNQQTGYANIPHFKSTVINNGIDLDEFDPDNVMRKNLRKELKIPEDACVISFIGRLTAQKDPFTLIKAFKEVSLLHSNAVLLIVGDGELKENAMLLVKELKIENAVVFENFRADVPDMLFSSDIFCLPSLWEGFSIGLLEAMAMRKAVVATDVDGTKEMIRDKKNGIIIHPQQVQSLAASLSELITDQPLRLTLGNAARQSIIHEFNAYTMAKKTEDVYINALNQN